MSARRFHVFLIASVTVTALAAGLLAIGVFGRLSPWAGAPDSVPAAGWVEPTAGATGPAGATAPTGVTPSVGTAPPAESGEPDVTDPAGRPGTDPAGTGRLPGSTRPGTRPPVIDHGPRSGNRVALTFDADLTDSMLYSLRTGQVRSYANLAIVELLERQQVPATFFLTGKWVEQYPQLTRRLAANPRFELANHTYGHLAFTGDCYGLPRLPANQMTGDVRKTFDVIEPYGGRQTRYFRFPGLCHDGAALAALAPLGLTVVDGDVISGDPFATAWRPIVNAVLSKVRPGSVVVLHVTEANAAMTDEALPHILAGLRERGLVPAPLSEVLGVVCEPGRDRHTTDCTP